MCSRLAAVCPDRLLSSSPAAMWSSSLDRSPELEGFSSFWMSLLGSEENRRERICHSLIILIWMLHYCDIPSTPDFLNSTLDIFRTKTKKQDVAQCEFYNDWVFVIETLLEWVLFTEIRGKIIFFLLCGCVGGGGTGGACQLTRSPKFWKQLSTHTTSHHQEAQQWLESTNILSQSFDYFSWLFLYICRYI